MAELAPVICIDGPSASGKGTVAQRVAEHLGWHYLDSGALYRAVGWAARGAGVDLADEAGLAELAAGLDISFRDGDIFLGGESAGAEIRGEAAGEAASRVAALPAVRAALLQRQRDFRQAPGLVADGRDMASVVFPDAGCKVFLTASAEARADRRYKQLIDKGMCANFAALLEDIRRRDERDSARAAAPLRKTADALLLDTTALTIDQAVEAVLEFRRGGGKSGG